jgi:hypothetical protein
MNQNKKVLQFVVIMAAMLLSFSFFVQYNNPKIETLQNINIISDVFEQPKIANSKKPIATKINILEKAKPVVDSTLKINTAFNDINRITGFYADSNAIVLPKFIAKLIALQKTKKQKIRIAYLGDSMIEGDLVTQTIRKQLQAYFGGVGVGFVPITSLVAGFRTTVKHSFSSNWKESNFKLKISNAPLFISGKSFFANGYNWVDIEDKTAIGNQNKIDKYLLCSYKPGTAQIAVNSIFNSIKPANNFNAIKIETSASNKIKLESSDVNFPIYGVSFESNEGIILDNFSFRGAGGFEFTNLDAAFLNEINTTHPYDLIIMQYGVNVLNKPANNSFDWYYKAMLGSINKLKTSFSNAEFLLISTADKSFKYSNGTHTAIGMDSLIATQQKIAFDAKMAFFNTYNSMGGYNSMVNWATANPQLAAKDFTHLNAKGAEVLGNGIFNSLLFEYKKASK